MAFIHSALRFVRAHRYASIAVVVVAIALLVFGVLKFNAKEPATVAAVSGPFVQQVSASGKVVPAEEVAMSFEDTGRISRIYVDVGDTVERGDPLVSLELGTLAADLRSAEAAVAIKRIEIENLEATVEKVRSQQDTLVASAYRTLLTDDLTAVPGSGAQGLTPPVITGVYKGTTEGSYRLRILQPQIGRFTYELRTFGIETTGPVAVLEDEPTPLGTKGLYVSFPDGDDAYGDSSWEVFIPNTKSASYAANYNAYQEALRERDRRILEAENELRASAQGMTVAEAELKRAEADLARIRTEIAARTLRAPFSGVVTDVSVELGGAVSISDPAVSLISDGALEIESYIPEINISNLSVGDPATVTLDAYGEQVPFSATVLAIDPRETVRDGVSTYRVRLAFVEEDERVRPGMTANLIITTDERENVTTVPQGAVTQKGGAAYVTVVREGGQEKRTVTTGAISSLGEIEIVSGLAAGEAVLVK